MFAWCYLCGSWCYLYGYLNLKGLTMGYYLAKEFKDSDMMMNLVFADSDEAIKYVVSVYEWLVTNLDEVLIAIERYKIPDTEAVDAILRTMLCTEDYYVFAGFVKSANSLTRAERLHKGNNWERRCETLGLV